MHQGRKNRMITPPKAVMFDVFGTLVDWRGSITREVKAAFEGHDLPIPADEFADIWRAQYQPSMAPVRSGHRAYQPLEVLHRENLDRVFAEIECKNPLDESQTKTLVDGWERLDPWPDVPMGLARLRKSTLIAPCSNGSFGLMARLARYADFKWDFILGAALAQDYKPSASVYLKSAEALALDPKDIMMVAAHNDDLTAADALGFQTGFFPRPHEHGAQQKSDLEPAGKWTIIARDLVHLATQLTEGR